jgi:hypothetical protein
MGSKKDKTQMVINTIEAKFKKNRNGKKHDIRANPFRLHP